MRCLRPSDIGWFIWAVAAAVAADYRASAAATRRAHRPCRRRRSLVMRGQRVLPDEQLTDRAATDTRGTRVVRRRDPAHPSGTTHRSVPAPSMSAMKIERDRISRGPPHIPQERVWMSRPLDNRRATPTTRGIRTSECWIRRSRAHPDRYEPAWSPRLRWRDIPGSCGTRRIPITRRGEGRAREQRRARNDEPRKRGGSVGSVNTHCVGTARRKG